MLDRFTKQQVFDAKALAEREGMGLGVQTIGGEEVMVLLPPGYPLSLLWMTTVLVHTKWSEA